MTLALRIDMNSLEKAASGVIWGSVWLEIEGADFPEANWSDLAVAFAVDILKAVRTIHCRGYAQRIQFFDGPFWVELEQPGADAIVISTNQGVTGRYSSEEIRGFVNQLEATSRQLVRACRDKGWAGQADVRNLEILIAAE
jgi:hypothetical protein